MRGAKPVRATDWESIVFGTRWGLRRGRKQMTKFVKFVASAHLFCIASRRLVADQGPTRTGSRGHVGRGVAGLAGQPLPGRAYTAAL